MKRLSIRVRRTRVKTEPRVVAAKTPATNVTALEATTAVGARPKSTIASSMCRAVTDRRACRSSATTNANARLVARKKKHGNSRFMPVISVCQNAATCQSHLHSFVCLCAESFTGLYCKSSISPCVEEPCLNGGTCRDREGMISCDCAQGFIGLNCSVLCPCRHGTCLAVPESPATAFSCSCFFGFTRQLCDVDINDCQSGPCTNGGSCVDARGYYRCDCSVGYKGINCETNISDCTESPCVNGGTCVDGVDGL